MGSSLAVLAFASLLSKLTSTPCPTLLEIKKALGDTTKYPKKAPLFVTWNKNDTLRGCIGTFLAIDIESGVSEYALISAMEDSRFPPISARELSLLSVSVTLLTNFEQIYDCEDWKIGVHGLKVQLQANGRSYLGTFLPSVAEEQEWTQLETLWNLLRKAGYRGISQGGTLDFYAQLMAVEHMTLTRYEGLKYSLSYSGYRELSHE